MKRLTLSRLWLWVWAAGVVAGVGPSMAMGFSCNPADYVSPAAMAGTASSECFGTYGINKTWDRNSGGVPYTNFCVCENAMGASPGNYWHSCAGGGGGDFNPSPTGSNWPVWLDWDLGQTFFLKNMLYWNGGPLTYRSLKNVNISVSTDGINWTLVGNYTWEKRVAYCTPAVEIPFDYLRVRYLVVDCDTNWVNPTSPEETPNTYWNLSETAFGVDPNSIVAVETGGSTNVAEQGPTSDTYRISLISQPVANVTITVNHDGQVTVNPASVVFTPADWADKTITVTAVDDTIAQGPHTSTISHMVSSTDPTYASATLRNVVVYIADNDLPSINITESGGSTNVQEPPQAGTTDTYTVQLGSQPTSNVTITPSYPSSQLNVTPASLVFTAANWHTPQTLTVTALLDNVPSPPNGHHDVAVINTAASGDTGYNHLTAAVTVHITDSEPYCGQPGTTYYPADLNGDCVVDLKDFAIFAGQWLKCTDPFTPDSCPPYHP